MCGELPFSIDPRIDDAGEFLKVPLQDNNGYLWPAAVADEIVYTHSSIDYFSITATFSATLFTMIAPCCSRCLSNAIRFPSVSKDQLHVAFNQCISSCHVVVHVLAAVDGW